jgi:hypothetical protein
MYLYAKIITLPSQIYEMNEQLHCSIQCAIRAPFSAHHSRILTQLCVHVNM